MTLSIEFENAYRSVEMLSELLKKDRGRLEPRLGAGIIDGMFADGPLLRESTLEATSARRARRTATLGQDSAALSLYGRVMAGRGACKRGRLDRQVCNVAGVGRPMKVSVVASVLDGARAILEAYAQFPDQLRSVGVLPADIEQIRALSASLETVDAAQEHTKVTAKEKTAARNAAYKRVKDAISIIVGAAGLQFVDDPERLALYEAVLPVQKRARPAPVPKA